MCQTIGCRFVQFHDVREQTGTKNAISGHQNPLAMMITFAVVLQLHMALSARVTNLEGSKLQGQGSL